MMLAPPGAAAARLAPVSAPGRLLPAEAVARGARVSGAADASRLAATALAVAAAAGPPSRARGGLRAAPSAARRWRIARGVGPTAAWDPTGGPAVQQPLAEEAVAQVRSGETNRVIWMCWTGNNAVPSHLRLCLRTIQRNAGLPVILVTPSNVLRFLPDLHPAYEFLHLQHRADYLRCRLLHDYGGIYLDMDTICLRDLSPLFDLLQTYDAIGYDGSQWGELIGISDMGPFKPRTGLTRKWLESLRAKLDRALPAFRARQGYPFYWQEILRDIFVPASLIHRDRVSASLLAHNPEQDVLWSLRPAQDVLGPVLDRTHILILNNSLYGAELACLSEEAIVGGPAVLSQVLRTALGLPAPPGAA